MTLTGILSLSKSNKVIETGDIVMHKQSGQLLLVKESDVKHESQREMIMRSWNVMILNLIQDNQVIASTETTTIPQQVIEDFVKSNGRLARLTKNAQQ